MFNIFVYTSIGLGCNCAFSDLRDFVNVCKERDFTPCFRYYYDADDECYLSLIYMETQLEKIWVASVCSYFKMRLFINDKGLLQYEKVGV